MLASLRRRTTVRTRLERQRSLSHRRTHHFDRKVLSDPLCPAEPSQPGGCQHDRVVLPFVELAKPRIDVAANRLDHQIRTGRVDLSDAPQRSRPHLCTGRQIEELTADHRIARIFPLGSRDDREPRRHLSRHVLQAVYRQIDAPIQKRVLDLFREQSLVTDLFQRPALKAVTSGRDHFDACLHPDGGEPRLNVVRLPQRKLRSS